MTRVPVSALVLTRNEELNVIACLRSLAFADDVVVLDSESTDRTIEYARSFPNVRVIVRAFDNWSSHQNWALGSIAFVHPWVLQIDADERVTEALAAAVRATCVPDSPYSGFRVRRRDYFRNRWIKHAQPTSRIIRLYRPKHVTFSRRVNPVATVDGTVGDISGWIDHFPFSKGVAQWFARHNEYSSFEAAELVANRHERLHLGRIVAPDPLSRRAALKRLFYRLPLRPQIKWLYYMIVRRAWLDGAPGMSYARLAYVYECMISAKLTELREAPPTSTK